MKLASLLALFISASSVFAVDLDLPKLATGLSGSPNWDKKVNEGGAVEYKSNGSNYRTFKPTVSPTTDGGLLVSTKINHIRKLGGDDHALITMTFDSNGTLVEKTTLEIKMGDKSFNTDILVEAASKGGAKAGAAAVVAAQISKQLAEQITKWGEKGGRLNLPTVVEHNINHIAASIQK